MNYEISRILNIDEVPEFDSMFYTSLPFMNNGTYPWPEDAITDEEKYNLFKQTCVTTLSQSDSFFFIAKTDGIAIKLDGGTRYAGGYLALFYGIGDRVNGSLSWIHDIDVTIKQKEFLINNGFRGILLSAMPDQSAEKYILGGYAKIPGTTFETLTTPPGILTRITKIDFN